MPTTPIVRFLRVAAAVVGTVMIGLLAGPLVYRGVEAIGADVPYIKVFRYLLLVLLLGLGMWAMKPWRDAPKDLFGLRGERSRPLLAIPGALAALAALVSIALADALAGNLIWDAEHGTTKLLERLPASLLRAAVVGIIEEVFFRGWLFERFRRRRGVGASAILVAVVYAGIHAFRESHGPRRLGPGFDQGLEILRGWGATLLDMDSFGPSFLGLFALSLALTGAYLRFRTLWFGIGLHAAAVAYLPLHSAATQRLIDRNWLGSKWLYDGVPGWIAIGLLAALLWPWRAAKASAASTVPPSAPPTVS